MSDPLTPSRAPRISLTEEQGRAVSTLSRHLYVTAAAGSGKTAVLTERVFRLVSGTIDHDLPPIELERLLVITFTRKAAQEMRERVERRLREALQDEPESAALRAALDALPRASIMTIDAFCDRLVRRHFHLAGVLPTVRIADNDEEREIVHTATREVFEAAASGEGALDADAFTSLLRSTPPTAMGGLLESLEDRVDRLRKYVGSLEDSAGWMSATRETLKAKMAARSFDELPDEAQLTHALGSDLEELAEALEALAAAAEKESPGLAEVPAAEAWKLSIHRFREWSASASHSPHGLMTRLWGKIREWQATAPEAAVLRGLHTKKVCGPSLYASPLPALLKQFSEDFRKWIDDWFSLSFEQLMEAERLAGEQGLALLDMAEAVETQAQVIKRRRGLLSFADMQRKALDLLTLDGGPSAVARDYQEFFRFVLVDEYQDVSPLQDALIRRVSRESDPASGVEGNLFVVGDVKQSIYRFRRAEPALFRKRIDDSLEPPDVSSPVALSLSTNFRSHAGLLEGINRIFEGLMDRRIGDVEMTGDALLTPGRKLSVPDSALEDGPVIELRWIDRSNLANTKGDHGDSDEDTADEGKADAADVRGIEAEARWIASRIRELENDKSARVPDKDAPSGMRPVRASDCAILVRSLAGSVETWIAGLSRWNISVRTAGGESLWSSVEGDDLLSALRLVDHPFDDIALATVLRSPIAGFTDDELLKLRMTRRSGPFWEAVWQAAGRELPGDDTADESSMQEETDPALREKITLFLARLDRWRTLARSQSAEAILDAILSETDYEAHLLGGRRAEAAIRNVDELRSRIRARQNQISHAPGLTDFLRALRIEGGRADEREDESLRDDPNAVQLMTIHKSKGLEFPVVFLARMNQRFQVDGKASALLFSPEGLLAISAVDSARKVRLEPLSLLALHQAEAHASRGEEIRLLYVAMTRARERLVLVGSGGALAKHANAGSSLIEIGDVAPAIARLRAVSPAALVGPRVCSLWRNVPPPEWLRIHDDDGLPAPPEQRDISILRHALADTDCDSPSGRAGQSWRNAVESFALNESISLPSGLSAPAPPLLVREPDGRALRHTPLKLAPSQIGAAKEATAPWRDDIEKSGEVLLFGEEEALSVVRGSLSNLRPRFAWDSEAASIDPTLRGRLTHILMQHLDLSAILDEADLRLQAEALFDRGLFEIQDPGSLNLLPFSSIGRFCSSELGKRLRSQFGLRRGGVLREVPISYWLPASELKLPGPKNDTDEEPRGEPGRLVLIQGVIDCILDEGDRITVIDYKTDRIRSSSDIDRIRDTYRGQILHYTEALRRAWRLDRAPEACLILLDTGDCVPVD